MTERSVMRSQAYASRQHLLDRQDGKVRRWTSYARDWE
jgi:hypothetical protein